MQHFAVCVCGAGPAGATAALGLRRLSGASVALVDQDTFPRDKPCGDAIGPGVVEVADRLDADLFAGFEPVSNLKLSYANELCFDGEIPNQNGNRWSGYVIPRQIFDDRICKKAIESGATDFTGFRLVDAVWEPENEHWQILLRRSDDGTVTRRFTAHVLIGADGVSSKVRRILLKNRWHPAMHSGIGARIYGRLDSCSSDSKIRLAFLNDIRPGYAWMFNSNSKYINIGVGLDTHILKDSDINIFDLLIDQISVFNTQGLIFDKSTYRTFPLYYGTNMPPLAYPHRNSALVGDAAAMINPCSGEGISNAMKASLLLVEKLAMWSDGREPLGHALHSYELDVRMKYEEHFRTAEKIKKLMSYKYINKSALKTISSNESLLNEIIHVIFSDKKSIDGDFYLKYIFESSKNYWQESKLFSNIFDFVMRRA